MIPSSSDLSTKLLYYLAEPAFRALVLAALAGLGLALARAKDAAVRLTVWTAVLYTSRAMPFLARLAPTVPLPIPAFLTARAASPSTQGRMRSAVTGSPVQVVGAAKPFALSSVRPVLGQPQGLPVRPATRNISWQFAAAALDLLVAAILLGRLAVGFYFSRQVTLLSRPISDGRGLQFLLEQSRRWGLRTAPGLAESPAVAVPVTLGWRRPVILLPVAWRGWREEKMRAVLAHELSHVARKDALTRALAAIHRGIFWFSPLAWWLERQLAVLAEQASDDAALSTGADRVLYANVLLGFYQDLKRLRTRSLGGCGHDPRKTSARESGQNSRFDSKAFGRPEKACLGVGCTTGSACDLRAGGRAARGRAKAPSGDQTCVGYDNCGCSIGLAGSAGRTAIAFDPSGSSRAQARSSRRPGS